MAITVAIVIRNMCLSRRWKADSISFGSCIRTLASLTYHMAQKPDRTTAIQAVHYMSRTKAGLQNAVTTEPYIKMSHMSIQRKAEFVGDIFHMRSFWGAHGEILPRACFMQERWCVQGLPRTLSSTSPRDPSDMGVAKSQVVVPHLHYLHHLSA
jgi:hypothetical protein